MEEQIANNVKPLVSVLMTTYNRAGFIEEAIESVLASTYKNWELIILDDCSVDNTKEIVEKYLCDSRISYYLNKENLGQFPNRNKIVEFANGELIKYLDSDDVIYPHGLEVMVNAIQAFPEAGIAVSNHKPDDIKPYPILLTPEQAYYQQFLGRGVLDVGPSAWIIRKKAFINVNGFPENNYVGNDTIFVLNMAAKYSVVKMPTSLIWWRQHDGQAFSQGQYSNEYLLNNFKQVNQILSSSECPLCILDKKKAITRQKQHFARMLWSMAIKQRKIMLFLRAFKASQMTIIDLISGLKPYYK